MSGLILWKSLTLLIVLWNDVIELCGFQFGIEIFRFGGFRVLDLVYLCVILVFAV